MHACDPDSGEAEGGIELQLRRLRQLEQWGRSRRMRVQQQLLMIFFSRRI